MPTEPLQPVGQLKKVGTVPQGGQLPNEPNPTAPQPKGQLRKVGEATIESPKVYGTFDEKEKDLEPILNEIVRTSKGGEMGDNEKNILRDVLTNPNVTPQQAKEAIQTVQGYHPKQKDNEYAKYYLQKDENGVLMPKPLAYGERPPEGYDVASAWGNPKQAKDDAWYTDVAKTLYNGVLETAKGVTALGQMGYNLATDKDSQYLNEVMNTAERLKFTKDEDLNKPIYNTEGVTKFADLVDKDRFDISPESIWGTLNMVGESMVSFMAGAGAAANATKVITGAEKLGKAGQLGAAFAGTYMSMLSDNLDHVKAAGLEGRDAASVAGLTTAVQSVIETAFGLEADIFRKALGKQGGSELITRLVANVEKDAQGKITEAGFKQLAKELSTAYTDVAKSAGKEFVKDVSKETFTEASQDFTAKAAEQLWDKLSDEDKAKFGTDITSPKAFASYIENAIAGLAGGMPMGGISAVQNSYQKQSDTAFSVVNQGQDKVDEFKANVYQQWRQGDLTEQQRDQAIFKIEAYGKYAKQVAGFPNMDDKDKKEAFELSFNIEALKDEINIPKEDLAKLDPIALGKIKAKETLIDGLQKELNHILLKQDIQQETKVGQDTVNKVAKNEGVEMTDAEGKAREATREELVDELGKKRRFSEDKNIKKPERETIDKITPEMSRDNPLKVKTILQEHLKTTPNNEMDVTIHSDKNGRYVFMVGEGKPVRFAQSVKGDEAATTPNYFKYENLPEGRVDIEDKGGDAEAQNQGEPEHYFSEPAVVKRVEFDSKDKDGKPMVKAVLPVYNKKTGKFIGFAREHKVGKSDYSGREDTSHLRHIIDSNLYDDSLKGYEHKAENKAAVPPYRYHSVEEYVQDYIDQKIESTPQAQQFYENNKEAIEAEFRKQFDEQEAAKQKAEKPKRNNKLPDEYFEGKRVVPEDGMTEEDYIDEVYAESENPAQIAEAYLMSPKNEKIEGANQYSTNDIQDAAYNFFSQHKLTKEAFDKILDPNFRNTKDLPALRQYVDMSGKKGVDADASYLREQSDNLTPQDLADFIMNYPNGIGEYSSQRKTSKKWKLAQKFKYFTEKNLTDNLAKRIHAEDIARQNDVAQSEEESALDEEYQRGLEEEQARTEAFAQTGQFQKKAKSTISYGEAVERLRKAMPKVNVVLDETIDAAGQAQGNTIKINPFYAALDTPIHEFAHILIDSIGYDNKVIQKAINALKDTPLWKEVQQEYSDLNEEMLAKEVLAEAIGREGADIFESEKDKSKFMTYLNYIFDRFKTLLGLNRNIAKSLAKQLIAGIGTSEMQGTNEAVQEKRSKQTPEQEIAKKEAQKIIDAINEHEDLSSIPYEELAEAYYEITRLPAFSGKDAMIKNIKSRIALNMKARGMANAAYQVDEGILANKDISWFDKWFKVLSHFSDAFPEMKEFSKLWDSAHFAKMKEARELKKRHDHYAEAVVKERNKKLGLSVERAKELLVDRGHEYFGFVDNGKGKIKTVQEAKAAGLSAPQIDYIKHLRQLVFSLRNEGMHDVDLDNIDLDIIKADKSFSEAFQSDGFVSAVGAAFGGGNDLYDTEITFTNPNTGKIQKAKFGNIQNIYAKYAEKGVAEKAKAFVMLARLGFQAKRQLKADYDSGKKRKGKADFVTLDENGKLTSKFGGNWDVNRKYSKDFYSAANAFIDDQMHIKHISKLVPVINSLEYLNDKGIYMGGEAISNKKDNLAEWWHEWTKLHVLQKPNPSDPVVDAALKFLRFTTSGITMWFAVSANAMNVAIGNYNAIRQEGLKTWLKGQRRLFGKDGINKYGYDIVKKYVTVSNDIDSNPFMSARGKFWQLGQLGQKYGEFQIQASSLLGLLSDEDFDSFEYKDVDGIKELVVKEGVDEQALEGRILSAMNQVSDVQGKYSAKDRRNVMNNEFGKAAMQFKVWIPDWYRMRFGEEGSAKIAFNNFFKDACKELREEVKSKGFVQTYKDNKAFAQNLRGALSVGLLMILVHSDDDDEETSLAAEYADRMLRDVLFIFNPETLKFTVKNPIAAAGTIEKFSNALEHLFLMTEYKSDSKFGDKGDLRIQGDILEATPLGNAVELGQMIEGEE